MLRNQFWSLYSSVTETLLCISPSQRLHFFCTRMMIFDRTKRVSHSMSFRHSIALFKVFLHSFKNETMFDTKLSKTWHASFFTCFKDFLKTIMDTFNFTTTIKLKKSIAITKFVRKKSAFFISKFLFEFKFFKCIDFGLGTTVTKRSLVSENIFQTFLSSIFQQKILIIALKVVADDFLNGAWLETNSTRYVKPSTSMK